MKLIVGFSRSKSNWAILSYLIRFIENTAFSHTYFKIESESLNRNLIYEATGTGVFFKSEVIFVDHALIVEEYEFLISTDSKTKLLQNCIDNCGKSYGSLQLVGFVLVRFCKLFGFNIKNPFSDGKQTYICTELVASLLTDMGYELGSDLDNKGLKELNEKIASIGIKIKG